MDRYSIIEQFNEVHIKQLMELFKVTWWTVDRTLEQTMTMLRTSTGFGLIDNETQKLVGFARVLSDEMRYAFIFDVVLAESLRGQGLGKKIMNYLLSHPRFKDVVCFELTCAPDMIEFYEQFGFTKSYEPVVPMRFKKQ